MLKSSHVSVAFFFFGLCAMQASASQKEALGFIEGSSLQLLNKNFFMSRDYRNATDLDSNREEWAHAVMAFYESGYTQGSIGIGLDAHAFVGVRLDSGRGRSGLGAIPVDGDGAPRKEFSSANGAVKARWSNTQLKYGSLMPATPVFATGTARLIPATAEGLLIISDEIEDLSLQFGHFNRGTSGASTNRDGKFYSAYGATEFSKADFAGFTLSVNDHLNAAFYIGEYADLWRQHYGSLAYNKPISDRESISIITNAYKVSDIDKANGGKIDVLAWSLTGTYQLGWHAVTLGYQQIKGDEPFDYLLQDLSNAGNSIYLGNSVQYSDFNAPNEKSVQIRYDIDMNALGVPGLSFMARYTKGFNIDGTKADPNGAYAGVYAADEKHWERNFEAKYVVQSGKAKDLSIHLRQATHRASSFDRDIDEVRVIIQYPLEVL